MQCTCTNGNAIVNGMFSHESLLLLLLLSSSSHLSRIGDICGAISCGMFSFALNTLLVSPETKNTHNDRLPVTIEHSQRCDVAKCAWFALSEKRQNRTRNKTKIIQRRLILSLVSLGFGGLTFSSSRFSLYSSFPSHVE